MKAFKKYFKYAVPVLLVKLLKTLEMGEKEVKEIPIWKLSSATFPFRYSQTTSVVLWDCPQSKKQDNENKEVPAAGI